MAGNSKGGTIGREDFLRLLEFVEPGIALRDDGVDQSDCVVISGGKIRSFSEEIACEVPAPPCLAAADGAVRAKPLLDLVRKIPDDVLEVEMGKGEFLIRGASGRRRSGVTAEKDVVLPRIRKEDRPRDWAEPGEGFSRAVGVVHACAELDEDEFSHACVHVHPKWLEACSQFQLCRWKIKTGLAEPALVRRFSIRHVIRLEVAGIADSERWVHFKDSSGGVLSCRRFSVEGEEAFPDMEPMMDHAGAVPVSLPKGLVESSGVAAVFADSTVDGQLVTVSLRPGRLEIRGHGLSGWYEESKKIKGYAGKPLRFMISPELLAEIVDEHNECLLTRGRLVVKNDSMTYCICLVDPEDFQEHVRNRAEGGAGDDDDGRDD